MPAPTKRQREVLDIITRHLETNGYRPSYQSIAKTLGLKARSGIARLVCDLESQGLLERQRENGHFMIEMKNPGTTVSIAWLDLPGNDDQKSDPVPLTLPSFLIGIYQPDEIRAMRITDSSMAPEIDVDDIALIELRDYCRSGQPVVALLRGETTVLRKYYRVGSEIELHSANDEIKPIILTANDVRIIGIYRGLIRPAV
ncbi:MAG: S24 family peptidase [Pyrinomonadaceae bacterium]